MSTPRAKPKRPRNWNDRIRNAHKRGGFTAQDRKLAADWKTCAVGEQRQKYPDVIRFEPVPLDFFAPVNVPTDLQLIKLGGWQQGFYRAVEYDNVAEARRLLRQIEVRALELKKEHERKAS